MTIYDGSSCGVCGAVVPSGLVAFHLEWHEATENRGQRPVENSGEELPIERMLKVVAALQGLPEVSPRPEFVSDLRARLLADTTEQLVGVHAAGPAIPQQTPVPAGEY